MAPTAHSTTPHLPWEEYKYNAAPYWSLRIGDGPADILVARLEVQPGFLGHWHWDVLYYPDWRLGQWPPLSASGVELGSEAAERAALAALAELLHPPAKPTSQQLSFFGRLSDASQEGGEVHNP